VTLIVREYVTSDGKKPFRLWLSTLDTTTRERVQRRIFRLELGNLGDHNALLDGLWELRLVFGSGYRIYFGKDSGASVVLLPGGSKAAQRQDIWKARQFWRDYLDGGGDGQKK
jgi:putative addiction module killer protein